MSRRFNDRSFKEMLDALLAPARPPEPRACAVCGQHFQPKKGCHHQQMCGPRCVQVRKRANYSDEYRSDLNERERRRVLRGKREAKSAAHMQAAIMAIPEIAKLLKTEGDEK